MKLTLQITASASTLSAILAKLSEVAQPYEIDGMTLPPAAVTPPLVPSPAAGPVVAPVGMPAIPPSVPAAAPTSGDDDDGGPADLNAPDTDSTGLPWDERIHSSTKGINADGKWKKRRGADVTTIATVEAELRARTGTPAPAPVAMPSIPMQPSPMPMAAPAPMAQPLPPMPAQGEPTLAPLPLQQAVDAAHGMPAPSPSPEGLDFAGFMQHLNELTKRHDPQGGPLVHADYLADLTKRISDAYVTAGRLATPLGSIVDIQHDPSMVTYAAQLMTADGRW